MLMAAENDPENIRFMKIPSMPRSSLIGSAVAALLALPGAWAAIAPGSNNIGAVWFIGDSITQSNADGDSNGSPRKSLYDLLVANGYTFTYTGHYTANVDGLPATGGTADTNLYQYHSGISGSVIGDNFSGRTGMTQNTPSFWTSGRLATVKPNVILIMLGTNDVDQNIDLANAPARLTTLVNTIFAQPGVGNPTVMVASIPPNRTTLPADPLNTATFNAAVPGVVTAQRALGRDVYFVDQFTPLDNDYANLMMLDNLHTNAAGNNSLARQWFNRIAAVVGPVDHPPVATAQSVTTTQDIAKAITLAASDEDGNNLTYTIVAPPAHGSLGGSVPNLTYTPVAGYSGTDSFTFKANDGILDSAPATVSLTVIPMTFTWISGVAGNWSDSGKWNYTAPVSAGNEAYVINFNISGNYTSTNNLGVGFMLNQLNFGGSSAILAGNSLALVSHGAAQPHLNQSGSVAVQVGTNLVLASNTIAGGGGSGTLTINGAISGAGGLTKTSSGQLLLSGTNTYAGPTIVSSGILRVTKPAALYNAVAANWSAANITVGAGATLRLQIGGTTEFSSAQIVTLLGNLATVNHNGLLAGSVIGFETLWTALPVTHAGNVTDSVGPGGGAVGIRKYGNSTLTFTGTNTYSGGTMVVAGTLVCTQPAALGSGPLDITTGAKLQLNFTGTRRIAALTFNGGATQPNGSYGSSTSSATNKNDSYFAGTGMVTVGPDGTASYSAWANNPAQGLTAGANDGPADDPDHDGIPNLLEFALGGAPMTPSRAIPPVLTELAGVWRFEYDRSGASRPPVTTQIVEYGSDLTGWTRLVVPEGSSGIVVVTPGTPGDHVRVNLPVAPGGRWFARLKVSAE